MNLFKTIILILAIGVSTTFAQDKSFKKVTNLEKLKNKISEYSNKTNSITSDFIQEKHLEILEKPESLIKYVEDRMGHDRRYAIDSSKMQKELGWTPAYSFEDGMEKTVEWYRKNENWWSPLKKTQPQEESLK